MKQGDKVVVSGDGRRGKLKRRIIGTSGDVGGMFSSWQASREEAEEMKREAWQLAARWEARGGRWQLAAVKAVLVPVCTQNSPL